jgi:hypothetical protein
MNLCFMSTASSARADPINHKLIATHVVPRTMTPPPRETLATGVTVASMSYIS